MARSPPLVKDKYFDDVNLKLPYTEASVAYKKKTYRGSVHDMQQVSQHLHMSIHRGRVAVSDVLFDCNA